MKARFLGTNGWYDTRGRNTLSVLIETGSSYIVFDAGSGFTKLDRYVRDSRPIYLFLSHFHLDHIIGLHGLDKFAFPQGIDIFGPEGIKEMFHCVINTPYSKPLRKLKTKIRVRTLDMMPGLPFRLIFRKLFHSVRCYGYRLYAENRTVAFCTDTGVCKSLNLLASDADLLIAESSLLPGSVDRGWPHLNPEQAATAAKEAKVRKLVLAHFNPVLYPGRREIGSAVDVARRIFRNTIAAEDNLFLEV